ncbi:MAG: TonB-dependent receptor [Caulobacterales bacterium]
MKKFHTTSVFAIAMALAGPTFAQQVAAPDGPAQGGLGEIIVTANRRSENLQKVPIAITAVTQEQLKSKGVFETTDLGGSMPNLQVSSPYGKQQPNFSLRGIGVGTEYNANVASPVGVNVDEVYQTFRASHGQQLYDLEQIEVLRGPQGTLYGRNTTGGAINFMSRKPKLQGNTGYATVGVSRYDNISLEGALEFTPIEDVLGIRIAGTYVNSDSYMHNLLPAGVNATNGTGANFGNLNTGRDPGGPESYGYRANVLWEPTDALSVGFKLYGAQTKGGVEVPLSTGPSLTDDTVDLRNSALAGLYGIGLDALLPAPYSRDGRGLSDKEVEVDSVGEAKTRAEGAVLNVSYDLTDALKAVNIVGFDSGKYAQLPNTDCDGTPYRVCSIGYETRFKAWNEDFRLQYSSEKFNGTVGVYYGWDQAKAANRPDFFNFLSDVNLAAGGVPTDFNPGGAFTGTPLAGLSSTGLPTGIRALQQFTQTRESKAIYGEGKYAILSNLNLTLGARYTKDNFKYGDALTTYFDDAGNARMYTVNSELAPFIIGVSPGTVQPLNVKSDSAKVTGRAIVDWTPVDDVMLYASYSRGYRGGSFNGLAYGSTAQVYFVKPESVDAYEVGTKGRFLDDKLQVNLAAFMYKYKNQQGQIVDQTATAFLISLDGDMKGAEAEVQYQALSNLRLSGSLGYLDSSYKHGQCPALPISGPPPQVGNCLSTGVGNIDVGGNPFPYAADWSGNVAFDWDAMAIGDATLKVHGDAAYTGKFAFDSFGDYDYTSATGGPGGGPVNSRNLARGKFHQGGGDYWLLNARVSYDTPAYTLAVWGKNLTDETYYPFGINLETLFGAGYRVRGAPRTYGVELTARF